MLAHLSNFIFACWLGNKSRIESNGSEKIVCREEDSSCAKAVCICIRGCVWEKEASESASVLSLQSDPRMNLFGKLKSEEERNIVLTLHNHEKPIIANPEYTSSENSY